MNRTVPTTGAADTSVEFDIEQAVRQRYAEASRTTAPALCCPVAYNPDYLRILPQELVERDYGCGDPSRYVGPGETVLDLGSGGGKICYIASQVVGAAGRVIGVDWTDEMLALARKYQHEISHAIGYANVRFHKGSIQDLALDLEVFERYLAAHPVRTANDWLLAEAHADRLRRTEPMVGDGSVDVVVSNCVLNLVRPQDRARLFAEIFRVLKPGGRAVVSDITCDEPVPEALKQDAQLWSGCLSGAFLETELLGSFEAAGFCGLEMVERQEEPWAAIEGIEFRSMTVRAFKGQPGPLREHCQAVIYKGPCKSVADDEGNLTTVPGADSGGPKRCCTSVRV